MPSVDLDSWKSFFQANPGMHLLQSGEWGELKSAFGWKVERIIFGSVGIQLLFKKLPFGYTVAYAPRASISAIKSLISGKLTSEVERTCRLNKSVFLKIEPDCWETDLSLGSDVFRLSSHSIQPLSTIEVDLTGEEEDILARMKQKCRYNIRLAEKKGIVIRQSSDVKEFYALMQETGGRDGFEVHSLEYYQRVFNLSYLNGTMNLLVAEFEGVPLASLMVFAVGQRSWYLYGASSDRERNRMPAYLLQWKAMQWARQKGCKTYDLWGIPDETEQILERDFETRHDGLWGVYRFKRGFGGMVRRAHPPLDRVFQPLLYKVYAYRQKLRGITE